MFLLLFVCLAGSMFAQSPFAFRQTSPATLELTESGKPVFAYNFGEILKPGVPERYRRSDYLHPVFAPDGTVISDDFPKDHRHHRGISWSWPWVKVDGKVYDLWELVPGIRQKFVRWTARQTDPETARLGVENGWYVEGRKVVREFVEIRVEPVHENRRIMDFTLRFEAIDRPVQIAGSDGLGLGGRRKGYGGFQFRFAPSQQTVIRTDAGDELRDDLLVPHPWAEFRGVFGGHLETARIDIDPSNPGYPNGWLLRHFGVLGISFPGLTPYTLEPGKPLVLKYLVSINSPNEPPSVSHAPAKGFTDFARNMVDLEALSHVNFVPTRMESSFDRTGGNQDGFDLARLQSNSYTIADLRGPGVIRRIYTARPGGRLRIFIDGNSTPVVDMPAEEFFAGHHAPFLRPAVGPMGFANYCYFPIPYAKSIKIQTVPLGKPGPEAYGFYYQVTYQSFPRGTPIKSLQLPLDANQQAEWTRVLGAWRNVGKDPKPDAPGQLTVTREVTVQKGESTVLSDLQGAGVIDRLYLDVHSADPAFLRTTLLKMHWDDQPDDSVDCPVGDFFGNGFNQVRYKSLPMGLTENGYYSYFSMPYGKRARIRIVNESATAPVTLKFRVVYHKTAGLPTDVGYFHAKWRRQEVVAVNLHGHNLTGGYNYRVLDAHGQGRFIGLNLNVFNRGLYWWGEGDPMIFVDNEPWPPGIHGTGTEEYFNDAYGFHRHIESAGADPSANEQNVIPVSGALLPGIGAPSGCYGPNAVFSFNLMDSVPFRERILVTFEHGTEDNRTNDYASTAYWYARPGSQDFFTMPPVQDRLAVPPEKWLSMRAELEKKSLPRLREGLKRVAAAIRHKPTDASDYKQRMALIWSALMVPGPDKLPDDLRARLQDMLIGAIGKPASEQWKALDTVLLEVAARVQ